MDSASTLGRNTHFSIAVHILTILAVMKDKPVPSAKLAESVGTNPAFLRQLMGELKNLGYIESQLGVGGGASLLKQAGDINLAKLYKEIEGGIHFKTHSANVKKCAVAFCIEDTFTELSTKVDESVQNILGEVTVEDLAKRSIEIHLTQQKEKQ